MIHKKNTKVLTAKIRHIKSVIASAVKKGLKPYETSPNGRKSFDTNCITAVLIWKYERNMTYRNVVDEINCLIDLCDVFELKSAHIVSTLHNVFCKLSFEFMKWCIR